MTQYLHQFRQFLSQAEDFNKFSAWWEKEVGSTCELFPEVKKYQIDLCYQVTTLQAKVEFLEAAINELKTKLTPPLVPTPIPDAAV